jgi:hypothetical protein
VTTNAADAVEEALAQALVHELKLDLTRARYIAGCALTQARFTRSDDMYGLDGKGLFARAWDDNPPEVLAAYFNWICVPVINEARQKVNRHLDFFAKCKILGLGLSTFDWLPKPESWLDGLEDAIAFTAAAGASTYFIDAEAAFFHQGTAASAFVTAARGFCNAHGIRLGFTSYGDPHWAPAFPWDPFCKQTDVSIAQAYDMDHQLVANYADRAIQGYRDFGAPRVILGRGLFRNDPSGTPHPRWRHPDELRAHLALTPPGVTSVAFWPPAGKVPQPLLDELSHWNVPAAGGVREALSNLTPFGKLTRD